MLGKQNAIVSDTLVTVLRRPRSPTEDISCYKTHVQESISKREFFHKLGPGMAKTIWIIRDISDLISTPPSSSHATPIQIESDWFEAANSSKWRIVLFPTSEKSFLGIYLETSTSCNSFPQIAHYTIIAYLLKSNSKLEKVLHKTSKDTFTLEHPLIGYPKLLPHSKLSALPSTCLFLTITVKTSTLPETCKKLTGYVGLINEGTTCYMNCLLQTLFLITSFRRAIYSIPISDCEEGKIPKALGQLFAALQLSEKPLSTQDLLRSFGWARDQWHEQQDVQEFSYKFSDTLEKSMNGTPAQGTYAQLFRGQLLQQIRCVDIAHESSRCEDFIDLQLDVKGCGNIYESFGRYVEPVMLTGEMQYEAEGHGKQDARKSVRFLRLPAVLQIQLKRFEYKASRGMMTKINEKFEFYAEIELNSYVVQGAEGNRYRLFSILAHSGTLGKGHYSSFISPGLDDMWYQFNDMTVDKALATQAIEANWGGEIEDISISDSGNIVYGKKKCNTSAYMLVYIRISEKNSVLPHISDLDIPLKLRQTEPRLECKTRETRKTARLVGYKIAFATKETIIGWEGPGISHFTNKDSFLIHQARKNVNFQEFIDTKLAYITDARLWAFTPGPVHWKFREIHLQDMLSQHCFTGEVNTAVFIESKHKIFTGSAGNWSWNEQDSTSVNGKHDPGKIFVFVKKIEKNHTKVVGYEWVIDKNVLELRKRLFEKYGDVGIEGWVCLERSGTQEIRLEEMYSFFQLGKGVGKAIKLDISECPEEKKRVIYFDSGDIFIIGYDPIDACRCIRDSYNSITVEAIYHDNLTFFDFKSHSRKLFEKHLLGTNFTISLQISSTQLEVMTQIQQTLQIPGLDLSYIQLLDSSYRPVSSTDFFLSKILMSNKLYFDIVDCNTLEDEIRHQTVIEFSQDFTPLNKFNIVVKGICSIDKIMEVIDSSYEVFLFKYQQRAVLRVLGEGEELSEIPPGVILGVRQGAETVGKKERVKNIQRILGFHGFCIDEGTSRPFVIIAGVNYM